MQSASHRAHAHLRNVVRGYQPVAFKLAISKLSDVKARALCRSAGACGLPVAAAAATAAPGGDAATRPRLAQLSAAAGPLMTSPSGRG